MINQKSEYYVFTRIKRGDDLLFIGSVDADSDNLAKVYANYTYDEEDWFEMFVVKKDDFLQVKLSDGVMNYQSRVKGAEVV
ncbi:hypothetical protein [Desertibacillus haloalkaliphilus]|uniref:hypothetical protein n=1 Tax=Desertibacillus haloalkaliphilus TaxID=1328930 RepID=UPI001C271560|nr:hypothetical protein [Desertibacillus haloalkaliphilus]MBU8908224.1 hypothetical protein [Desertibacillus haloalkaliphilus]